MAEESSKATSQRVYRRKPADVAEAKFIAGLITKFVQDSTKQLAEEARHDELYTVLGYQRDWNGIVADLEARDAPKAQLAPPQIREADQGVNIPTTAQTSPNEMAGGGTPRSNRARTNAST